VLSLAADFTNPVHDERRDSDDRHREDHVSGDGEPVRDALPGTADAVPDQGDHGHPGRRADQAEDPEQERWHLDAARNEGHERADNR
jgi:hypothetical protein